MDNDQEAIDVLKAVRTLLTNSNHWTQNALARDANDVSCWPYAEGAVCWCLMGAIVKQNPTDETHKAITERLAITAPRVPNNNMFGDINDRITHRQLLNWLDRAVKHDTP